MYDAYLLSSGLYRRFGILTRSAPVGVRRLYCRYGISPIPKDFDQISVILKSAPRKNILGADGLCNQLFAMQTTYARMLETTPEPTVLPPSRIAKRRPSSQAMGVISSTVISTLSPGRHISTPAGSSITPVTSVVLK